jgi:hypothetical protein
MLSLAFLHRILPQVQRRTKVQRSTRLTLSFQLEGTNTIFQLTIHLVYLKVKTLFYIFTLFARSDANHIKTCRLAEIKNIISTFFLASIPESQKFFNKT